MSKEDDTIAPTTEREAETNPRASEAPIELRSEQRLAVAPPPPDDLASTQLANREPPEWFKSSYIGQALTKFAGDADDIRKGRATQHSEQMRALSSLDSKLGRFGERIGNLENEQRKMGRSLGNIQDEQVRQASTYAQERREIRSLLTTAMLRLELLENGHSEQRLRGVRVLIVEDEDMLTKTLIKMLARDGAIAHVAQGWDDAKMVVEEQEIDFALVDVRLGGGEDGIQLTEWLMKRLHLPAQRFLLMTGFMDPTRSELAEEMGLRVVDKPFDGNQLVCIIREGLDVSGTAAPPG